MEHTCKSVDFCVAKIRLGETGSPSVMFLSPKCANVSALEFIVPAHQSWSLLDSIHCIYVMKLVDKIIYQLCVRCMG